MASNVKGDEMAKKTKPPAKKIGTVKPLMVIN